MNRREILGFGTAATFATVAGIAMAADDPQAGGHDIHQMAAGHEHHGAGSRYADLVAATSHCVTAGDACLSHCLTLLGEGDKELAACAKTVRDTIAACTALRELAAADSPHVKDLAKVVSGICGDCEAECKKHEKHSVCKDCEKACRDCKEVCDRVSAAA
jgi:Cys-rich four helix bundle protein (predicted Tat secretion target)